MDSFIRVLKTVIKDSLEAIGQSVLGGNWQ